MAEEVEALVAGMVEALVVVAVISVVVAISAAAISPVAVAISVVVAVSAVAIALRNTEEGISSTGIASSTEIISGTIAISFLEVPFCMITPTTGMIIRTTGTTDIRTTDIVRTTAFAVS